MDKRALLKKLSRKSGVKLPPIEQSDDHVKTILDVDPDFYSLVDGRPIRPDTSIRKYKQNIKDLALKRTLYGFISDEILRVEKDIKTEANIYKIALNNFNECQESFNKFLADDNNKTITVMKKSDNLDKELAYQIDEHKKGSYELASLKSKLQYIEDTLQILLSFQRFLYNAAPILWQQAHKFTTGNFQFFAMESDIFCKIDVEVIKEKLKELPPPQLYFKTSHQIMAMFQSLETHNLNYLLKAEELRCDKNKFMESIHGIEDDISKKVEREKELKQEFFKILQSRIKFLVSSEMVLKISTYVEFVYEQLISPNETKLTTLDQVHALEQEYNTIMLDLSIFDLNYIKSIEKKTYEESIKEIKQAKKAAKLLRDVDKLNKRLTLSYDLNKKL
ncbi:structural maintenance of chromosomes protein 2-like [Battus philenor]|uniref:structural maintenance of chromosomes protein 2-like n=1 Tax=Battus philenor TaxID=42288 RepID=UPI0035D05FE9